MQTNHVEADKSVFVTDDRIQDFALRKALKDFDSRFNWIILLTLSRRIISKGNQNLSYKIGEK